MKWKEVFVVPLFQTSDGETEQIAPKATSEGYKFGAPQALPADGFHF